MGDHFIEHVRAHGWLGCLQDFLTPTWRTLGAGCHSHQRTVERIRAAGFSVEQLKRRRAALASLVTGVAQSCDLPGSTAGK